MNQESDHLLVFPATVWRIWQHKPTLNPRHPGSERYIYGSNSSGPLSSTSVMIAVFMTRENCLRSEIRAALIEVIRNRKERRDEHRRKGKLID
jgi:hypothetical protein